MTKQAHDHGGDQFSANSANSPGGGPGPVGAIAGYLIEEKIGEGGMAVVYRARDERLDRPVALKVLAPWLTADPGFRQRFIRESRSAAAVDHPCIIPIYEAGDVGGSLFIAMRYVRGGDVRKLLDQGGPLPPARVWSIISQVASALDAAHTHGLIHRDVKPANMLLDHRPGSTGPGGISLAGDLTQHVYLSDFGISKQSLAASSLTMTGQFVGTLDYIAPEQIEGGALDGRTDQYSLGCAAYELLSGTPPFSATQGLALVRAHIADPPPEVTALRRDLPPAVNGVLAAAMAKQPADRFGTCAQFAVNLGRALGLVPGAPELPRGSAAGPAHPRTELAAAAPGPAAPIAAGWPQQATVAPPGPAPAGPGGTGQPPHSHRPHPHRPHQPHRSRPHSPSSDSPKSEYPNSDSPNSDSPNPYSPNPHSPNPHSPNSHSPNSHRSRSRGTIIGAVGAVAVVGAAATVAYLLLGHGNHAAQANDLGRHTAVVQHSRRTASSSAPVPSTSAPSTPATSSPASLPSTTPAVGTAPTPDPAATAQATAVSNLLASGNGSADNLNAAVNDVANCGSIASDISEIQSVESQRQDEYAQAQSTQMSDLPDAAALKSDLLQALHYSLVADSDYLAYANQMESSSCQAGSQAAAQAADTQAVTYKTQFVSLWNPTAGEYGLPQLTISSI
jgi:serine/threonine-protein kinase